MSLRDKFRKLKSDTKSRIFQANEAKDKRNTIASPTQAPLATTHRWPHLRTFLGTLQRATRSVPPLQAAVTELVECVDSYDSIWRERREYEKLYHELEGLFQTLQHHYNQVIPPSITTAVEALCKSIRDEISDIHRLQDSGKVRKHLEGEQGTDAVLERYRRIQGHLQRISLNADISIWRIVDHIATDNRLKYLSPSLSACYNSAQAVELKRGSCTEGTRVDLLGQILGWAGSSDSGSIYWMNGMAGTGKTTVAYTLCEELDAACKLAASFFCSRLLPECRDVNLIIPSIAFQLARSSHPFRFALSSVLEKDPDVHTRLPHLQFDALISQPLLEVQGTLPENLVVVIDALDECENKESTCRILEVLLAKSANLPLKFIVSSRPEPEIRDEMAKQTDQAKSRVVLHELDKLVVQADIEAYLQSALSQVQPTKDQITTLVERAGTLFIYAATVVRYITHDRFRRNPRARLVNVLESSSKSENKQKEIDELYTIILRAAVDDPDLDSGERDDVVQVLNSVICAQEPLTIDVLSKLLKMNDIDRVRAALRPLWSVLHISGADERVTTLHASFPDYMLDPLRSKNYYCDSGVHNGRMAECCFDLFRTMRPQFNICNLQSSFIADSQVEGLDERIHDVISAELFYASRYWAIHLHSAAGSPGLMGDLEEFLSLRLLLWMEVMNLKKCTGTMHIAIRLVEKWGTKRSGELNALIHDAWRFTSAFALGAISDGTPHIYMSMLPFWPQSSPVSECYARYTSRMVQIDGTALRRRQLALLATWTLSDVAYSSVFSPDGTQIAVGAGAGILLLNSSTGRTLLSPFQGHSHDVSSVQFLADGAWIVSGSYDGIIVWSTRTGEPVLGPLGLDKADSTIISIALSHDSTTIVGGSSAGKIYVWETCSGRCVFALGLDEGYGKEVTSVKFSPKGNQIVYCNAGKISICDSQEGQVLRILGSENRLHRFKSADISPDGAHIASGSDNGSIYIWGYETGQVTLGPLQVPGIGSSRRVKIITFAPDGLHLISGSQSGAICIWSTQTGDLLFGPLEGYTNLLTSICFSPDGAYFASVSSLGTLNLWDIQVKVTELGENNINSIESVGFLSDRTHIISNFNSKTICVWDVEDGKITLGPLEGYDGYRMQVLRSPDGMRILSTTQQGVMLLDAHTGKVALGPFRPSKGIPLMGAAASADGRCVAFGLPGGVVRLLATDTGQTRLVIHLSPTDDGMNQVCAIIFFPHSTQIAISSYTDELSIYDARDGRLMHGPFPAKVYQHDSLGFSPDGTRIVYSTGSSILVKDVQTGGELLELPETGAFESSAIQFTPDGSRIVAGLSNGSIGVWDARTGQLLLGPIKWHSDQVHLVGLSPDSTQLVCGSRDNIIRVTDIQPVPVAADSLTRNFGEWEMRDNGWVVDELSRLLVWIPADLRTVLMWPRTRLVISRKGYLRLNFEGACLGETWADCYHAAQR